jgi:hypothetical protein
MISATNNVRQKEEEKSTTKKTKKRKQCAWEKKRKAMCVVRACGLRIGAALTLLVYVRFWLPGIVFLFVTFPRAQVLIYELLPLRCPLLYSPFVSQMT